MIMDQLNCGFAKKLSIKLFTQQGRDGGIVLDTHLDRDLLRDLTTGLLLFGLDLERERLREERRERDLENVQVFIIHIQCLCKKQCVLCLLSQNSIIKSSQPRKMVNNIVSSFESCGKFISKQILEYVCVLLKKCFLLMFYIIRIGFAVQQTVLLLNFSQYCVFFLVKQIRNYTIIHKKCIILPGSATSAVPGARSAAAR